MPSDAQNQALTQAVGALRAVEQQLLDASRQSNDPNQLMRLNLEYNHVDSWLSQVLHAQAESDDALFAQATASLKQSADALKAEAAAMQKVVGDVGTAAKIAGYLAQAATAIAGL